MIEFREFESPKLKLIEDLGMMYPTENSKHKRRFGMYECGFCGTHFKTHTASVKSGATKSCGCYNRSRTSKHGDSDSKLYSTWTDMKTRTSNKRNIHYSNYGGRGISICNEWKDDFVAFKDWALENGYEEDKGLSIDRIDVNGNYEPTNCRWANDTIQNRNQRLKSSNTSGYKGVSFHKRALKFTAQIGINKKMVHLGYFETALEGAIAYNNYIIENNLDGFNLNIIPELEFKEEEN